MPAPSKDQQDAEADARRQSAIAPGETAAATDIVDDSAAPVAAPPLQPEAQPPQPAPPPVEARRSRRAEIVAKFRSARDEDNKAEREDLAEFARSGVPHEFDAPSAAPEERPDAPAADDVSEAPAPTEADAQPQPGADAAPEAPAKTVKVKVNGQIVDMPLEDVIAQAQISLAAKDVLGEAKQLRSELQTLVDQNKVQRPDQPGHHAEPSVAQPELPPPASQDPNQDPYDKLLQELQFGDPAVAKEMLRDTIGQEARRFVTSGMQEERLRDEGARTARILSDFEKNHPELAADDMARAAIERKVLELQTEDIKALGVDPARLPTRTGTVTPLDIADAHRYYRANGFKVRSPDVILEKAKDDFLEWKGETKQPQPRPSAPRVEITPDRSARRQAVPQQPGRTVAPRPAPQPAAPARRDPSSVVDKMRESRLRPRQGALGGRAQ